MTKGTDRKDARANALDEYREAVAFMRHDDQIAWTIIGLYTTVASGLWAYTFKDLPFCSLRAVLLSLLGVFVLTLGRLLARRVTALTRSRRKRAESLEDTLGFRLLTDLEAGLPKWVLGINRLLDGVTFMAWAVWIVYFVAYLLPGKCR